MKKLFLCAFAALMISACNTVDDATFAVNNNTNSGGGSSGGSSTSSTKSVYLSWSASSGTVEGYQVQQSTDGVNFSLVQTVSGTATSTTISGLATGNKYYFRISAYNPSGTSGYSAVVSASL